MSDASGTSDVNYIPSLDAANHLISLFKTPVGALGGSAGSSTAERTKRRPCHSMFEAIPSTTQHTVSLQWSFTPPLPKAPTP